MIVFPACLTTHLSEWKHVHMCPFAIRQQAIIWINLIDQLIDKSTTYFLPLVTWAQNIYSRNPRVLRIGLRCPHSLHRGSSHSVASLCWSTNCWWLRYRSLHHAAACTLKCVSTWLQTHTTTRYVDGMSGSDEWFSLYCADKQIVANRCHSHDLGSRSG